MRAEGEGEGKGGEGTLSVVSALLVADFWSSGLFGDTASE